MKIMAVMEYLEGTSEDLLADVARHRWEVGLAIPPHRAPTTPYMLCWLRWRSYWSKMCSQA